MNSGLGTRGSGPASGGSELTAVLVDDEQLARDELSFQLGQTGTVTVVGQAINGVDALETIDRLKPDVVFLDVQMPGLTGFEVARRMIDAEAPSHLVFVTAYDQHAIEAFEVNAVDYLLKPVEVSRLEQALQRARRRVDAERIGPAAPLNDQLERSVKMMAGRQVRREQVALKVGERFMLVQAEEI